MSQEKNTAIATIDLQELAEDMGVDHRELELMKKRYFVEGGSEAEFELFITQAAHRELDPTRSHIYAVERKTWNPKTKKSESVIAHQVSIIGHRLIAERTGQYEGQTRPEWCGDDGQWRDIWLSGEPPRAARVGVYRKGFRDAVYATVLYTECVQTKAVYKNNQRTNEVEPNKFWTEMPAHMLAKVAESRALQRAFPEEFRGHSGQPESSQPLEPGRTTASTGQEPRDIVDIPTIPEPEGYRRPSVAASVAVEKPVRPPQRPPETPSRVVDQDTGEVTDTQPSEPKSAPEGDIEQQDMLQLVYGTFKWKQEDLRAVVHDRFGADAEIGTIGPDDMTELYQFLVTTDAAQRETLLQSIKAANTATQPNLEQQPDGRAHGAGGRDRAQAQEPVRTTDDHEGGVGDAESTKVG